MTDEWRIEAAEYVLGTLDAAERGAFERLLAADPAIKRETAALSRRFTALLDPRDSIDPSPEVWAAIRRRIDAPAEAPSPAGATVVPFRQPARTRRIAFGTLTGIAALLALFFASREMLRGPESGASKGTEVAQGDSAGAPVPVQPAARKSDVGAVPAQPAPGTAQGRISGPQVPHQGAVATAAATQGPGTGSVSTAAATPGLGSVSLGSGSIDFDSKPLAPAATPNSGARMTASAEPAGNAAPAAYVAVLKGDGSMLPVTVHIDTATRKMVVRVPPSAVPDGKSLQLWYGQEGGPLKPVGVIAGDTAHFTMPNGMTADRTTLAASLEPTGGSPTGMPTAPLLYRGQIERE